MPHAARIKRLLLTTAQYGGIVLATLLAIDVACITLGLFPPTYEYGEPDVGWVSAPPTGAMREDRCTEFSTGTTYTYARNEDGVRTDRRAAELQADSQAYLVAVTGDSQTDLCAPNAQTHAGVLETTLNASGLRAVVLPYGAGRYSPVQDYVVFKKVLLKYHPDAFVLNLYTGNDFYDILRVDDRPHFVRTDSGYTIAPPVWYLYDPPGMRRRSRVLFALRSIAKRTGVQGFIQRIRLLHAEAAEQGKGLGTVLAYMNDLRKSTEPSVGYPAAFSAQMLNQQLFFYRFPESRAESMRRVRALLQLIRRENPGLVLLLSPLPSYELVQQQPVDSALFRALARLPVTYEGGLREERALYDTLQALARDTGWLFVDNLRALQAYKGSDRLYNNFDYHLLPPASEIIGRAQAAVLLQGRARPRR
ncbi:MAG TPA: hypothetical protein VGJ80_04070 [Gemmatimonadales bacterium]